MNEVGKIIEQVIDLMNSGSYEAALLPTAKAIEATASKVVGKETVGDLSIERFYATIGDSLHLSACPTRYHCRLVRSFCVQRVIPTFNSYNRALRDRLDGREPNSANRPHPARIWF